MPNLGSHLTVFAMDGLDHLLPAGQGFSIEVGNVRVVGRPRTFDHRTFRENQAHLGTSTAGVVVDDLAGWNSLWRPGSCHRGQHDAVPQAEGFELEWFEENLIGHARTP